MVFSAALGSSVHLSSCDFGRSSRTVSLLCYSDHCLSRMAQMQFLAHRYPLDVSLAFSTEQLVPLKHPQLEAGGDGSH